MANARTSSSKRKGSKIGQVGGLGGPGGRGSTRKATRARKGGTGADFLSDDMLRKSPRALASAVAARAGRGAGSATPYRTAMTAISTYANRHSKSMLPETRTKLAAAKDELRVMFEEQREGKGTGGPGKKYAKPKAQSRRNPKPKKASTSARGGSHRAGGR